MELRPPADERSRTRMVLPQSPSKSAKAVVLRGRNSGDCHCASRRGATAVHAARMGESSHSGTGSPLRWRTFPLGVSRAASATIASPRSVTRPYRLSARWDSKRLTGSLRSRRSSSSPAGNADQMHVAKFGQHPRLPGLCAAEARNQHPRLDDGLDRVLDPRNAVELCVEPVYGPDPRRGERRVAGGEPVVDRAGRPRRPTGPSRRHGRKLASACAVTLIFHGLRAFIRPQKIERRRPTIQLVGSPS